MKYTAVVNVYLTIDANSIDDAHEVAEATASRILPIVADDVLENDEGDVASASAFASEVGSVYKDDD